jgi:imidazolonepropionase-like amidohydrolase
MMRRMQASLTALAVLSATAASASAETLAVTHAHIYSMGKPGEIASGTVLVEDGKIRAVGADVAVPAGARVIDARGRIVTPGLVVTGSTLGADEIEGVEQTVNSGAESHELSAGFDIQYSLNPDSTLLPVERQTGATAALATPEFRGGRRTASGDSLFNGQAAMISLGSGSDILLRAHVAIGVDAGDRGASRAGGSRGALLPELRAQLAEVREYRRNRTAFDQNRVHPFKLSREDLEALGPVVEGREPLLVEVHRASDIRQILAFARTEKVRVILSGVEEGWRVADDIAAAHVPVMLNSDEDLPVSFEKLASTLENASRLAAAGVEVSIHGPNLVTGGKAVRLAAGRAVGHGLPWATGLASVTVNPARALGVADRIGSLEPGKSADLVVWSGDPLDTSGAADLVMIKGREQSLHSRQLELRDRYLKPDNGLPPQYR